MKIITIFRGASGSGKSTVAKALAATTGGLIYSTDELFIDNEGIYRFDPSKLGYNHKKNIERVEDAMKFGNIQHIIVDNTNTTRKEMKPYVDLAKQYGYDVQYVTVERDTKICETSNQHGVPAEAIQRMKQRFQYENTKENE